MIGNLGFGELLIIAILFCLIVLPFWRISRKAGYPGFLALAYCIPIVNILVLLFFAFSEWPIEREVRELRTRGG